VTERETPIRVLIADDHDAFRAGLRALLETSPDLEVVGEVVAGPDAVAGAARLQPDVVLMDISMPGGDGIDATRRLTEGSPHIAVIVLTMDAGDASVTRALRAGARGYLLKGAQRVELVRAIRAAAAGEAILGADVARRLAGYLTPEAVRATTPFPALSEREHEVLDLIARGRSNGEIAATLVLAPKTIRNHVSNIFAKLEVRDRAEAIVRAREAGLGTD
jgi:DNA-binding NarL/FixJ family response regulator